MTGIAYQGAASNRFLADWTAQLTDANDDWWKDAPTLAARSWHLYDNDPYFHALVETLVSGTFGEGRAVFFKFKQSSQTSFEGVHELVITFVAPADWRSGDVRITCAARGHKPVFWTTQPTVFGEVDDVIHLYPEGDRRLRDAAVRRAEATKASDRGGVWSLGDLFVRGS